MLLIAVFLWPYVQELKDPEAQQQLREQIDGLGAWGYVLIVLIQIVQIVIMIIPGEFVEILAGVMYGGFGGLALCMLGCVLASILVFKGSQHFLKNFLQRQFDKDEMDRYSFLKDSKKVEILVFILFLLPGTPKDMLTYIAPLSRISLSTFLPLASIARIPSIVTSTFVGENLGRGNWETSLLIYAATAVFGLLGIWVKDKWIKRVRADE